MFRLPDWKLSRKLPLIIAIPAVLLVTASSGFQLQQAATAMEKDHLAAYKSYIHERRYAIEEWLADGRTDVAALAASYGIKAALRDFSGAWDTFDGDVSGEMRRLYISDNPNPLGQKDELVAADDGSNWSVAHEQHHVGLRSHQRARGYYDLFLFDMAGDLVYSVFKEDDFALNFNDGTYAESGLGEAFQSASILQAEEFHMTDIAAYAPSAGAPAMFISAPVFENGQAIGVVAVQLPLDDMTHILSDSEILGETGEVYLVDNNGVALSPSRHEGGHTALETLPNLEQIASALSGVEGHFASVIGLSGNMVVSETSDVETPRGDHWGLVLEIDRAESMKFFNQSLITSVIGVTLTGALLCLLVWFAVRSVIKRIGQLASELETMSEQNYDDEIAGQERKDEIGFISQTLANLQVRLREGVEAQAREKTVQENNQRVVDLLSTALMDLAKGDFRNQILEFFPVEHKKLRYSINDAMTSLSEVIISVRDTALGINGSAKEIASSADELSQRTEAQAATLEQTAAALEEVTASVRSATEHVDNVEKTVDIARDKAEQGGVVVNDTIQAITEVEQSSHKIKQIISVIDDIAFQTNLLALNAGVEAARAGEAGRGFAVVASEVRGLAQRSADAATEIKSLIETSSQQVGKGVEMVGRTGDALTVIVDQVKDISGLVKQIAQSSREQSIALSEINTGMSQLDQATQGNAAMVEENTAAAHMLRTDANKLIIHVEQFKTSESVDPMPTESSSAVDAPLEHEPDDVLEIEADPSPQVDNVKVANGQWTDF